MDKSSASSPAPRQLQDSYVNGLLQQIKLLELEINYLKQHQPNQGSPTREVKDRVEITFSEDNK